ncbi:hypothetical protein C1N70_01085 [Cytobacillus firmus]
MRDSYGSSGTGETPQTRSVEEAHRPPRGKRASWSGNQRTISISEKQQFIRKEPIEKTYDNKQVMRVINEIMDVRNCSHCSVVYLAVYRSNRYNA